MNKVVVIVSLILLGLFIVALPDSDIRLFSISKDHGPSLQDSIGLIILLFGYLWFIKLLWNRREKVFKYKNSTIFILLLFLFGTGLVLVIASVLNDFGYWWICGVVMLVIVQVIAFFIAFK